MSTSDGSTRKHSHYHKDVGHLLTMDVYRLCERFEINDPSGATQHAIKKLVCAGQRGSKGLLQDLQEAVDTINRRIEMIYEDQALDALLSTAFGQQNMIDPADVEISEQTSKCKGCFAGCRDCCPGLAKIADEKLARMRASSDERFVNEVYDRLVEPALQIEDDSDRMQAIGQNGNGGEHYDHERIPSFANCKIKSRTSPTEHFARLDSDGVYWSSRGLMFNMKHWQLLRRIK